ncbi:hypothetical protein AGOR_G00234430 [Albula goreensis]|uniref:Signal-transducing adaptor protein 1 n=1 Tax=Albula goreensis TaxID=1534307 RepID=A0A8T3CMC8_9TELE|nr:hypothetical protein AGOR_G00234430 [Albula goreensis]
MAALNSTGRVLSKRRQMITALPLYYSGYLHKKYTGEKDFKRFFGELRGSTIFLYADDTQDTYSEKVELCNLRAMVVDTPRTKTCLSVYTLTLLHEEIQLKIDNPDTAEEWRSFIMTVARLEIPCTLQLLPGQMMRLEQVLEQERQRTSRPIQPILSDPCCQRPCPPPSFSVSTEAYDDTLSHVPPCFFSVSRQEAEQMLEMNPERGSIILRPATDNVNYAITVRQVINSGPAMKHFRVRSEKSRFVIELDKPVTVPSLTAVVDHFLKTLPCLQPYIETEAYDTCIAVPLRSSVSPLGRPKSPLPKNIPLGRVAPMIQTKEALLPYPPLAQKAREEESEYLTPDFPEKGAVREELHQTLQRKDQRNVVGWE